MTGLIERSFDVKEYKTLGVRKRTKCPVLVTISGNRKILKYNSVPPEKIQVLRVGITPTIRLNYRLQGGQGSWPKAEPLPVVRSDIYQKYVKYVYMKAHYWPASQVRQVDPKWVLYKDKFLIPIGQDLLTAVYRCCADSLRGTNPGQLQILSGSRGCYCHLLRTECPHIDINI